MPDPGTAFGRYAILGTLGKGGFATVYRARDQALEREVAIKVLLPHLAEDPEIRQRFVAEARGIARLRHPNIATIYDVGEADGLPFFTMELIEGPTLARLLLGGPLPPAQVVALIRSLASAIDYLHRAGLVHRDIKPANIMLEAGGRVVLMDFGIARAIDQTTHTRTGTSLGTPEYMSPEQVRGERVGPASDIYALGVLTYNLLAGKPPFSGDTAYLLFAHAYEPPPPLREQRPNLPEAIYAAVGQALAKDPLQRLATAAAFAAALAGEAVVPPASVAGPAGDDAGMVNIARPRQFGAAPSAVEAADTRPSATLPTTFGAPATAPALPPAHAPAPIARAAVTSRRRRTLLVAIAAAVVVLVAAGGTAVLLTRSGGKQQANTAVAPGETAAPEPTDDGGAAGPAGASSPAPANISASAASAAPSSPAQAAPTTAAAGNPPAGSGATPDAGVQKQLSAAALSEAELGTGYLKLDESTELTRQAGVIATYDEAFLNLDLTGAGIQIAAVTLDAYTDPTAASAGLKTGTSSAFADTGADVKFQPASGGPKLGDETTTFKVTGQSEGVDLSGYAILWRRGRYTAGVLLLGTAAGGIDATTKLAQKQDDRLKSAAP
ncbi:MAG TPA: serine/threonine-protein kinase [Dehalococcoidia bacterium]|nr:serine/threonine-protein kinase [Dehalococcoidia bacterium]